MHPPALLVYVIKDFFFFPNNSFMHDHRLNDGSMQIYFMLPVRAKVQWGCFGYPPPISLSRTHSPWSQVGSQRCSGLTAMESFRNLRPVLWQKEGGRCFKRIGAVLNVQPAGRGDAAPPQYHTHPNTIEGGCEHASPETSSATFLYRGVVVSTTSAFGCCFAFYKTCHVVRLKHVFSLIICNICYGCLIIC